VTKGSDNLCGAKTAGFNIKGQNPSTQGEIVAHHLGLSLSLEFGVRTYHRGRCVNGCWYKVGIIHIPCTDLTSTGKYILQILMTVWTHINENT
jgi:hypothetical protein